MKALLINPHKLIPNSLSITFIASPPLGLAYIAGAVEAEGYEVEVYDCVAEAPNNYFPFDDKEDISVLGIGFDEMFHSLGKHYDLIGLSIMFSNNWLINRKLINELKQRYPAALIVAGGEHVSAIPEYCLKDCAGLDMVVIGEGEETIAEVAATLRDKTSYWETEGISYKIRSENDKVISTHRRQRIKELDEIVRPAWHVFPLDKYFDNGISYGISYGRSLPIFATRGCPYSCTFCSSPYMWGTKYSMREVNKVIEEIKWLNAEFGITNFDFYDLTAIIKREWILDFCERIEEEGLVITWQIPAGTRSEAIDYEVAVALKKSGCKNITYAPESGSVAMLKAIKKKVKLPRMLQSIDESYKAGLNVKLNILLGYPNETYSDIFKTHLFLMKASFYGATDASPSMFSPYPGSELFNELHERKEVYLNDDFFRAIVFSQSLHHMKNYNRNISKAMMIFMLFISYVVFYTSNYVFRPFRAYRLFRNVATNNYETRGEYMLGNILKRRKELKSV